MGPLIHAFSFQERLDDDDAADLDDDDEGNSIITRI